MAEGLVNGEDKVPVGASDELKGHSRRPVVGIFSPAGRAEFGVAPERDKLKTAAVGAAIHGTAVRGITAAYYLFNVFHNNRSGL